MEMDFGCSLMGPVAMGTEIAKSSMPMERRGVALQECCQLRPLHSATPLRAKWASQTSSLAAWTTTQQVSLELLMAWLDLVEIKIPCPAN
jgi:hypothetical protein